MNKSLDYRRFRANIYLDLDPDRGFGEDAFVGHRLSIGASATVEIVERDVRCKLITLDPETAEADPMIARHLAQAHQNRAGIYGSVLTEGVVRPEDPVLIFS